MDVCTYRRWTQGGEVKADGRPEAVRPEPANKLSAEERAQVLAILACPRLCEPAAGTDGAALSRSR